MERVRFRPTWYQRLAPLLPGALLVTSLTTAAPLLSPHPAGPDFTFAAAVWLAMPAALLLSARFGVTLTPTAAVVHNPGAGRSAGRTSRASGSSRTWECGGW